MITRNWLHPIYGLRVTEPTLWRSLKSITSIRQNLRSGLNVFKPNSTVSLKACKELANNWIKLEATTTDEVKLICTGKGNLIARAAQFRELGVSVSKELPAELVKIAKLELEHGTILSVLGQV